MSRYSRHDRSQRKDGVICRYNSRQEQYEKSLHLPQQLGTILPQLMAKYGFQRQLSSEKLRQSWVAAVGDEIGDQTQLGAVRRGTLEIRVAHNILAQELSFQTTQILAALQQSVPEEKIKKLRFVV